MTLVGNFLDFGIEECPFGGFDYKLEWFPIFKSSWFSVFAQRSITVIIPPFLGMFSDVDISSVRKPSLLKSRCEWIDDLLQWFAVCERRSVKGFKYGDDFLDKFLSFLTFLGYRELGRLDKFLSDGDGYCKGARSNISHQLGWIMWPLSSLDPLRRNIRSMTELDSPVVSEYLSVDCSLRYINLSYENHVVKFGNHKFRKND